MAFSVIFKTFLITSFLLVMGCGAPPNAADAAGGDKEPETPVLSSVSYLLNSVVTTLNAPIASTLNLQPDMTTGLCSALTNEAEITFLGTYETEKVTQMRITGPLLDDVQLSAGTFTIRACISSGSTAITIVGLTADDVASDPLELSITITPVLRTLAFGHPRYPGPGFRMQSGSASPASLTSNGLTVRQLVVSDSAQTTIASTGNTSYTMSVGFSNIVKEVSP
jgi:hypothetical protein